MPCPVLSPCCRKSSCCARSSSRCCVKKSSSSSSSSGVTTHLAEKTVSDGEQASHHHHHTKYDSIVAIPSEEEVIISRKEKCVDCCKKSIAFLFSTIGLTSMLVGYTIFGAFIFTKLEAPHEIRQKSHILDSRRWHIQQLWNATERFNVLREENWTLAAEILLENFSMEVYEATKKSGWDGKDGEADIQWTFAGAMLYSITVITTIGYGHIAPRTTWGRVVTIIYAIFGIPLCLLTLTNLGGFMATAFRYIYHNICCGLFCLCCESPQRRRARQAADSDKDGAGVPLSPTDGGNLGSPNGKGPSQGNSKQPAASMQVTWRSGISRVLKTEDNKTVTVPIYVSLLLIASYILSGAVLFTLWEDDWDYLVGSYFVFITLTTIGFGDYVPGTSVDSWNSQEKLVLCCMYLIFGLALIAMCFDLMQEEARNKMRKVAKKLGLMDKDKAQAQAGAGAEDSSKAVQTTSAANKPGDAGRPPKYSKEQPKDKSAKDLENASAKDNVSADWFTPGTAANMADTAPTEASPRKKSRFRFKSRGHRDKGAKHKDSASSSAADSASSSRSLNSRTGLKMRRPLFGRHKTKTQTNAAPREVELARITEL